MAEPTAGPAPSKSLVETATEWVAESGYALELRVADAFGPSASLGLHYEDSVQSGTWRETDVIFTRADQQVAVVVQYIVEAKATSNPWIVFRGNRRYVHDEALVETLHHAAVHAGLRNVRGLHRSPLLFHAGNTAYKLAVQAKARPGQQSKNDAWDATVQVLSAARGLAQEEQQRMDNHPHPLVHLFVPILLTGGPLLEASLTNAGIQVTQIEKALLTGQFPPDGQFRSVWVVSESYLPKLVAEAQPVPTLDNLT